MNQTNIASVHPAENADGTLAKPGPVLIDQRGRTTQAGRANPQLRKPSILATIEAAHSQEHLELLFNFAYHNTEADTGTKQTWAQAYLRRQLHLIRHAPTAENLVWQYNLLRFCYRVHPSMEDHIETIFQMRAKELPSKREREEATGIVYEGITKAA